MAEEFVENEAELNETVEQETKTVEKAPEVAVDLLVPQDMYLKSGIHIGTKFKTKYMEKFIYKTRPDGLSVLNLKKIDERIKVAAEMLSKYDPKDIVIVSRREQGWKPVKMFGRINKKINITKK